MKKLLIACLVFACASLNAQLKLYSTGNISIGSISQPPANVELQVVGNTLFSDSSAATVSSAYIKGLNTFSTDSLPDYSWWGDSLTGIFHPSLKALAFTNGGNETMRLSSSANILIGSQTDNGDRLQVTGKLNQNPLDIYTDFNSGSGYSGINWLNDTNTKAWAVKYNGQDKFYVYGDGQAYAYGWNTMSDSSLKENIRPIQNALEKVLKLEGVTYNLKLSAYSADRAREYIYPSSEKMGLIAQQVERVVPEVVSATSEGKKTVAYGNMVGLLVEALKEEDAKVEGLQRRLDSLAVNEENLSKTKSDEIVDNPKEAKLYPCKTCMSKDSIVVCCYIPEDSKDATLLVFDMNGKLQKDISIRGKEKQYVSLYNSGLSAGMYYYTLVVNGSEINTRKMIVTN